MHRNQGKYLALILLLAAACSSGKMRIKSVKPVKADEAREILGKTAENRADIPAIRLKADMKIDTKSERVFFKELISMERPGKMQMTSIKFGTPVLYISVSEGSATAYDPGENLFYSGANYGDVVEKLTGLSINVDELIEIVFGGLFIPPKFEILDAQLYNDRYYRILIRASALESREIMLDWQSKTFFWGKIESRNSISGEEVYIQFSDFRQTGKTLHPRKIVIRRLKPYLEVVLKIDEVAFPETMIKDEMEIRIPRGVVPLPIEQLGRLF